MQYDLTPNHPLSVQVHHVGTERQPVIVVDDFLRFPQAMVDFAANGSPFGPLTTQYPGVGAAVPAAYPQVLAKNLAALVGSTFGVKPESGQIVTSFFGIVTTPPENLNPSQRVPHVDCFNHGQIAFLQYFCDESQGGTAFYRHAATGYESMTEENQQVCVQTEDDIRAHGPPPARYLSSDDRLYEQTAAFEAKFNRMLIYRSAILHSGIILPGTRLDPDPRIGRLTTNTFVAFAPA